jgi:hypothetical protein
VDEQHAVGSIEQQYAGTDPWGGTGCGDGHPETESRDREASHVPQSADLRLACPLVYKAWNKPDNVIYAHRKEPSRHPFSPPFCRKVHKQTKAHKAYER